MFDEPSEDPTEKTFDQKTRAREKADEIRMYSELAAVFEGTRKFDAQIRTDLDADVARSVQRGMATLERAKLQDIPMVDPRKQPDVVELLSLPSTRDLATGDYHIHRRPGEVMIVRWLAGDEVETFYERFQAHFDVGWDGYREDERQANEWRQEPEILAYLKALEDIKVNIADMYLREPIRTHGIAVMSTQTADEFNIAYLADHVMSVPAAEIVGEASAPPEHPTEQDLTWFFKLFSLRSMVDGVERMCFFTFLQKTDDTFDFD